MDISVESREFNQRALDLIRYRGFGKSRALPVLAKRGVCCGSLFDLMIAALLGHEINYAYDREAALASWKKQGHLGCQKTIKCGRFSTPVAYVVNWKAFCKWARRPQTIAACFPSPASIMRCRKKEEDKEVRDFISHRLLTASDDNLRKMFRINADHGFDAEAQAVSPDGVPPGDNPPPSHIVPPDPYGNGVFGTLSDQAVAEFRRSGLTQDQREESDRIAREHQDGADGDDPFPAWCKPPAPPVGCESLPPCDDDGNPLPDSNFPPAAQEALHELLEAVEDNLEDQLLAEMADARAAEHDYEAQFGPE